MQLDGPRGEKVNVRAAARFFSGVLHPVVSENSNEPNELILWVLREVWKSSDPKICWSFPTDRGIVL